MNNFKRGLVAGIPIALGYLSVSFTFGIIAIRYGLSIWETVLISMTVVTSAGQFAGVQVMLTPGHYIEMLISQLTINVRYSFMSTALSQKVDSRFRGVWRWLLAFMMTDEIFAVASTEEVVTKSYFAGLITLPWIGWIIGTLLGAVLGNILPVAVMSALGLAIYAMFVAIVLPVMKEERPVTFAVIIAIILSICFTYVPVIKELSSGLSICICAIVAALVMAVLCPVEVSE